MTGRIIGNWKLSHTVTEITFYRHEKVKMKTKTVRSWFLKLLKVTKSRKSDDTDEHRSYTY